ncbi:MAG: lysylphosphatidylglycerol synthase domain-containing protein [Cyanobacteria bacterium P01_G01_bin.39]
MKSDRPTRWIYPLIGFLLLVFSLCILQQQLERYNLADILHSLSLISDRQLFLALSWAFLSCLIISSYDLIAFHHLNHYLDNKRILFATFVTYAISNTTGFTLLIGGGIRYRFYSLWGVPTRIIAKIIALGNLTFWLGLLTLGGIVFVFDPVPLPHSFAVKISAIRYLGIVALLLVATYLCCSSRRQRLKIKGRVVRFPKLTTSLAQISLFSLDWMLSAAILYCLIAEYPNKSYGQFFDIYLVSMTASIMSNVPGGIGIFETIIMFLLPQSIPTPDVLGSLLVYRAIRFLLPLAIALALIICFEIRRRLKKIYRSK